MVCSTVFPAALALMHDEFIGTMPVQERHRFDTDRLSAYMHANVAGFSGPL
jgi:hypothetical protein